MSRRRMSRSEALTLLASRRLDTHERALDARIAIDVAKWGESERDASRQMHQSRSHALLVNSIAVADIDAIDEDLMAAASAIMTSADRAALRKGG